MKIYIEQHVYVCIRLDGQVRLQTDNFRSFLCKQTDKRQTSVCTMSKQLNGSRKIAWASVFLFPFEMATYIYVYIVIYRSMYIYRYIYLYLYIFTYICCSFNIYVYMESGTENWSLFSLVGKTINGNQCTVSANVPIYVSIPSMYIYISYLNLLQSMLLKSWQFWLSRAASHSCMGGVSSLWEQKYVSKILFSADSISDILFSTPIRHSLTVAGDVIIYFRQWQCQRHLLNNSNRN